MVANRTRQRWTYAEFARLPSDGRVRHEVIDGELVVTPPPGLRHQAIVGQLVHRLVGYVNEEGLGAVFPGPVDVLFAEGDYLEPDLVFVRRERAHLLSDRGVEGSPDLVVEVLSPSTADRDRGIKLHRYRRFGVTEYWVVDPEQRAVEVWRLAEESTEPHRLRDGDTLGWRPEPGAPELEIEVTELFGPA